MKRTLLALGMVGAMAAANAVPFTFSPISNNSGQAAAVATQLLGDVSADTPAGVGQLLFTFRNIGEIPSVITQVYFDDENGVNLNGIAGLYAGSGVSFTTAGVVPNNLPGGNGLSPEFVADFAAGAVDPAPANGIELGESLGIVVNLFAGRGLADVVAALVEGTLRIGLHVQGIPGATGATGTYSDAFISSAQQTPQVPDASTTAMLLGVALLGLESLRRRVAK